MSKISDKYTSLKKAGLDLGADLHPGAPDMNAGYGGLYRQYKNGNIYFHPAASPVACEVHGGILTLYLAHGGPGIDPKTGKRLFGFPKTDETPLDMMKTPTSFFETGAIYWSQGSGGGAVLTGAAYQAYAATRSNYDAKIGPAGIGMPVTSNIAIAGGEAIYFERGVIWASNSVPNGHIVGKLFPPLLGTPAVLNPTGQPTLGNIVFFDSIPHATYDALTKSEPALFQTLWNNRLSLVNTGARNQRIPLNCVFTNAGFASPTANVDVSCRLDLIGSNTAQDSTLYDLELTIPQGAGFYPLSPHSVFMKKDWTNFGLLHITDIHLSLRNEHLRARLSAIHLDDAAKNYANCQDQFRDFIHYANHLHSLGLAHAVMATGDLVDYVAEVGDDPYGPSNFRRMRNMILGQPFDDGVRVGEELLIPIFTTFGNHDHRLNPYDLHCQLSVVKDAFIAAAALIVVPVIGPLLTISGEIAAFVLDEKGDLTFNLDNFSTFNLEQDEVDSIQGTVSNGKVSKHFNSYGVGDADKAFKFLQVASTYPYFDRYFGPRDNKVALGKHRMVLLDSGPDAGVPASVSPEALAKLLVNYIDGNLSPDTIELATGCPNSTGYNGTQLALLRQAVTEAGASGLVIVGVHLPPIAPAHGYNDFMRETEHAAANPENVEGYLKNTGVKTEGWTKNGTPFFKTGDVEGSLSFGIGTGGALDLLKICAGAGASRPIDMLLCGHHHDRVDYRIKWNAATSQIEYFNDFYTENPATYYTSTAFSADGKKNKPYRIIVDPHGKTGGVVGTLADKQIKPVTVYETLTVPGYADPLNSSNNPAAWWQTHRPVLVQTAALGPIDPRQRYTDRLADPTFQGFRLLVIRQDVISKVHYVNFWQLKAANFVMPFEREDNLPLNPAIPVNPVVLGR